MTNLSSVNRQKARTAAPGWHRRTAGLWVAGAGAALMGLLATPLAHADADDASLLLAAASTDLPDAAAAVALHHDLLTMYVTVTGFEHLDADSGGDALLFSDLTSADNILSATGFDVGGDRLGAGANASDYLSAIAAEDTTLTGQLANLEQEVISISDSCNGCTLAFTDMNEDEVILSTSSFQEQINYAINTLPTITAQEETSPLLISYLSALYNNEIDLGINLTNVGDEFEIPSAAGITAGNAGILSAALGMAADTQGSAEMLTILADLSSIGL